MKTQDLEFMQMALNAAGKGWPQVLPNPMVGCVITKNDQIMSTGHHQVYGGPHAEVNAIDQLPVFVDPRDCTLYVTLEPCSHFGKTPPCVDLIVAKGFKRVVVAVTDPNPLVSGQGIEKLRQAGIMVETGVLEKEATELNRRFITFHSKKRPYVILKWAMTSDGFVSRKPVPADRSQNIITRMEAQRMVHQLRANCQGIMVGKLTAMYDDPALTTRLVNGPNPVRIVIDRNLELSDKLKIYDGQAPTIVYNEKKEALLNNITFVKGAFGHDRLKEILRDLHSKGIQTILVEGGPTLLESFLKTGTWDEAYVFQNPDLVFGNGLKGPVFPLKNTFELVGEDKLFHHFKNEFLPAEGALGKEIF